MADSFFLGQRNNLGLALIQRAGRAGMELAHTLPNDGRIRELLAQRWGQATHAHRQTNATVNVPLSPRAQTIRYYDADSFVRMLINGSAAVPAESRRAGEAQKVPVTGGRHDPIHAPSEPRRARHSSFGNVSSATDPRRGRHGTGGGRGR